MKWVLGIVAALLLGVAALVVVSAANIGHAIEAGIETFGPEYLGTGVHVDEVEISLWNGSGRIRGFQIDNPEGFEGPYAMRLESMKLRLEPRSLLGDVIVVDELTLDGAEIHAEQIGHNNNIKTLSDRLSAASEPESASAETSESGETTYIIEHLNLINTRAELTSDLLGRSIDIEVPDLHLTGVGRESGGATAAQIAQQLSAPIVAAVIRGAQAAGVRIGRERLEQTLRERLGNTKDGAGNLLRGLLNRKD